MSIRTKKIGNDASNQIFVKLDTTVLEQLEKQLKKKFVAQIGVLGAKAGARNNKSAEGEALTNAEIGFIHEKGSKSRNIPRRSFLEYPLTTHMAPLMKQIGKTLLVGLNANNIEMVYKKLAVLGEGVVLKAFASAGFGTWAPNSPATIRRKGSSKPLIDTAQLRQSISSRVVTS